jgi:hypothetical protein
MPNALITPPSTTPMRSSGPPSNPAMSAQEPVSHAVAFNPVIHMAATGRM